MSVETSRPAGAVHDAPPHVPGELVRAFDFAFGSGTKSAPHVGLAALHDGPRTFFNVGDPYNPPGWVPVRGDDIRLILQDPATFSARKSVRFSALIGEDWDLIPAETDPPQHTDYRTMLAPAFSPKRMSDLDGRVRERAVDLVEQLRGQTSCEFMQAFGRAFPVNIFLSLMGLPSENIELFSKWMHDVLHGEDMAARSRGATEVAAYLRKAGDERRGQSGDDLITIVVNSKVKGRPLTDDEIIGALFLIFGGGIDTVAASLGFIFLHLARHPELQAQLRGDPSLVGDAVEEFLRRYSLVSVRRQVLRDVEAAGVAMKQGDWVHLMTPLASMDPDEFPDPLALDISRSPNRHTAFSYGPHRCIGSHLARRELVIALEEWLPRLPPFRLANGDAYRTHGGLLGVDWLNLVWD